MDIYTYAAFAYALTAGISLSTLALIIVIKWFMQRFSHV